VGILDRLGLRQAARRIGSFASYDNSPDFIQEIKIEADPALRKAKIPDWFLIHPYGRPRTDDIATLRTLAQMGIVQRCINLVLDQVFSIPWDIVPKSGVDISPQLESRRQEIKDFLMAVNSNEENYFKELRRALTDYLEIGEGFLVKMFNRDAYIPLQNQAVVPKGVPAQLLGVQSYDASQFYVFQDEYGRIMGHWQFNFVRSPPRFFSKRELIVFRDQPTNYFVYGRSRIKQIQDMLEWVFSQIKQTRQYYKSGAVFQGFIKTTGLNQTEQAVLEKYVAEKFAKQKHKLGIFHGGKDSDISFERLMLDVKDLAFLEGLDFVQKFVMSLFGVTPAELGITDSVNKASADQQSQVFQRRYRVMLNMIEYRTNQEIISELDPDALLEFKYIYDTDPTVKQVEQNIAASKLDKMQITINEWRREQGFDPVEWGDVPIQIQRMQQQQERIQQQMEQQKLLAQQDPEDNSAVDPRDEPSQKSSTEDKKKVLKSSQIEGEYLEDIEKAISDSLRDSRLSKIFNPIVKKIEKGLKSIFRLWLKLVRDRISRVDALTTTSQIDQIIQGIDSHEFASEIRAGITEAYQKGLQLNQNMELGFSLDRTDRRALDYIKEYPLIIAEHVRDDIHNALKRELHEGMSKGESIQKVKKRIQEVFDTTPRRAETIARTEVSNASAWGKINQIRSFGGKKWQFYATEDERTCPICMEHHEKIYSIDDLEYKPPLHPNCRCTILSVDEEEEEADFPITPKMAKIELESGNNIYKLLSTSNDSLRNLSKQWGVSYQTVSNWIQKFNDNHDEKGRFASGSNSPIGKVTIYTKDEHPYVAVEMEFKGYQGIKGLSELSQSGKITINHSILKKLNSKEGHLSVDEVIQVFQTPDFIYASTLPETNKIPVRIIGLKSNVSNKSKFVEIRIQGNVHELSTAHLIVTQKLDRKTKGWMKIYEKE